MSMSELRRYKLSTVAAELKAKHPPIEIEADDGTVFTVPHPAVWSDDVLALADKPLEFGKAILGAQHSQWVAAGGSMALLGAIVEDAAGVKLGESSAS